MDQGSDAWFEARLGKLTASRMGDMLARTKTGWGASRANYAAQLICERLTGKKAESYQNAAMLFGTENEPLARAAYEFRMDCEVELVGFVDHPTIAMSGASPDGLIGEDGMLEIKVPETATHLDTILTAKIPERYRLQMAWQLACKRRQWCDYVSFDPRLPEHMRLFVQRFHRDPAHEAELEHEARTFLGEIDDKIARLNLVCAA